jgi:hypothetical protein
LFAGAWSLGSAYLKTKEAPGEKRSALTRAPERVEFGPTHDTVNTNPVTNRIADNSVKRLQFSTPQKMKSEAILDKPRVITPVWNSFLIGKS